MKKSSINNLNELGPIVVIADEGYVLERSNKTYKALNGHDSK